MSVAYVASFVVLARVFSLVNAYNYHHRAYHAGIIANNVLYIDGGEITTWNLRGAGLGFNDTGPSNVVSVPDNVTHSIDLSQSWTNASVTINSIQKSAPVLNAGALWADASQQKIYAYNGGISPVAWKNSPNASLLANQLWSLTPSGSADGKWEQVQTTGNFSSLTSVQECAYTYGGDLGFAFGGYHWAPSETTAYGDQTFLPGMTVYNMTSRSWYNVSGGLDYASGFKGARSQFVSTFGPSGLLFTFGGDTVNVPNAAKDKMSFENAIIYEPTSQRWEFQSTSGDLPPPSTGSCVAGVQGDNGTYEIFLYGGLTQSSDNNKLSYSDGSVYVLSLPAFHWFKQPAASSGGRYRHTCTMINRQIIVAGGIFLPMPLGVGDLDIGGPDPWTNGLGVYDLTAMQWRPGYIANAPAYATPNTIKSHIQQNGQYPPSWNSDNLQRWFTSDSKAVKANATLTSPPADSTTSVSSSNQSSQPSQPSQSAPIGAIVGGVVGGVAFLIIVAIALFVFCRRRRRRPRGGKALASDGQEDSEAERQLRLPDSRNPAELKEDQRPYEAPEDGLYELEVDHKPAVIK